jgi:hypothetical protein
MVKDEQKVTWHDPIWDGMLDSRVVLQKKIINVNIFNCLEYNWSGAVVVVIVTGRWFSPVSSTYKTDRHDITEILLKVALCNTTITPHLSNMHKD